MSMLVLIWNCVYCKLKSSIFVEVDLLTSESSLGASYRRRAGGLHDGVTNVDPSIMLQRSGNTLVKSTVLVRGILMNNRTDPGQVGSFGQVIGVKVPGMQFNPGGKRRSVHGPWESHAADRRWWHVRLVPLSARPVSRPPVGPHDFQNLFTVLDTHGLDASVVLSELTTIFLYRVWIYEVSCLC